MFHNQHMHILRRLRVCICTLRLTQCDTTLTATALSWGILSPCPFSGGFRFLCWRILGLSRQLKWQAFVRMRNLASLSFLLKVQIRRNIAQWSKDVQRNSCGLCLKKHWASKINGQMCLSGPFVLKEVSKRRLQTHRNLADTSAFVFQTLYVCLCVFFPWAICSSVMSGWWKPIWYQTLPDVCKQNKPTK